MGKSYYDVLGVAKDADDKQIKSAYKKAAMKHHPDRNPDDVEGAGKRFKEVSEAFEVLSDSNKRAVYDQFGEEGLKGGGPPPPGAGGSGFGGGFPGGASGFPPGATFSFGGGMPGGMGGMPGMGGGGRSRGGFQPSDPDAIFSQFFGGGGGGGNPFASFGGGGGSSFMDTDSDDASPFGGASKRRAEPTVTEIIRPLPVSLEDLYTGTTKKLRVTKKRRNGQEEANTLEIAIKPGYKAGTKIKFAGAGHETATTSQDMVFIIEEKPHAVFKREGDDLVLNVKVPLVDALSGPTPPATNNRSVKMLDGRSVSYTLPYPKNGGPPLKPGQVIKVLNEGMPISRKTSAKKKGDLLIKLDVVFPTTVSASQAEGIRKVLG